MKKTKFLLFIVLSLFIFSCSKKEQINQSTIKEKNLQSQVLETFIEGKEALDGGDVLLMTEVGQEVTSLGVQIHGGMGYVEETGAAQYLRDVRITPIYEGTNGIQAADLANRKLARDGGAMMEAIQDEIRAVADALIGSSDDRLSAMGTALADALSAHVMSSQTLLDMCKSDKNAAMSASFDYMMQTGYLFGGWHLAASSLVAIDLLARNEKALFCQRKIATTEFYLHRLMPRASAHADAILSPLGTLDGYASDWL